MLRERSRVGQTWTKTCPYCHATGKDGMQLTYLFDCEGDMPYICHTCHRDELGFLYPELITDERKRDTDHLM